MVKHGETEVKCFGCFAFTMYDPASPSLRGTGLRALEGDGHCGVGVIRVELSEAGGLGNPRYSRLEIRATSEARERF